MQLAIALKFITIYLNTQTNILPISSSVLPIVSPTQLMILSDGSIKILAVMQIFHGNNGHKKRLPQLCTGAPLYAVIKVLRSFIHLHYIGMHGADP
jgi:hypothetical protein